MGRQADARRPGVPKENLHAQSTGSAAGGKSAALRPRSNGHDSSMVQELTEQVFVHWIPCLLWPQQDLHHAPATIFLAATPCSVLQGCKRNQSNNNDNCVILRYFYIEQCCQGGS